MAKLTPFKSAYMENGENGENSEQQVLLFNLKFYFEINENATIKFKCFLILKS